MCYISVFSIIMLWSICVELALSVLLMIRILKWFVTPTLTYTAQVDENIPLRSTKNCYTSVLIIIILSNICVALALQVLLVSCVIKCFVTPTLTYTAQVDESVLHICFDFRYIIEYMR